MSTLRTIRKRLRSVENIKQITKTMEMVAAARLRRAHAKAEQAQPYAFKIKEMLEKIAVASADFTHPLFQQREVKKIGLVVIAADRGLCGPYNHNIFSASDKFLKQHQSEDVELILIGSKAVGYYQHHRKSPIRHSLVGWGGKITHSEVKQLAEQLVNWFLVKDFDEIWLVYTHYISAFARRVVCEKFLNIGQPKSDKKSRTENYIFEPNPEEIYDELLPRYCVAKIQTALDEAYASELAARLFSMKAATKNAEEMIQKLTLIRNKVRQAGITKEMLEITSGAESLT